MTLDKAILATLAYHDIFDYPLTQEEIHKYLIGKKSSLFQIQTGLTKLKSAARIGERQNYFFLKNRKSLTKKRTQRAKYSQKKLKKAMLFANILKAVPTAKLVAVSGALTMQNSAKQDDIDLVIICAKNTLWTTRFLANLTLMPFKRYPKSSLVSDRACLNIFIDESNLKITPKNIYTAHEICQMRPLWDRSGIYRRFIRANEWVTKFLPNWMPNDERLTTNARIKSRKRVLVFELLAQVAKPLEALAKWGQLWYMRRKITTERIGDTQLFFHPKDTADWVLEEYRKRLKKLKIVIS